MSEQIVFTGKGVVYYYDPGKKNWTESPIKGYSRLDIYKNSATGGYRVIGRGIEDSKTVVINSMITRDTAYVRTKETFHQFQDPRYLYGLNFANKSEAETFADQFDNSVNVLKGASATAPIPTTAPAVPVPATSKQVTAPRAPVASNAPKAPGPPPPPKAPPASSARTDHPPNEPGRNSLLNSIEGFSKNNLKKDEADTVDKSGPLLPPQPHPTNPVTESSDSDPSATAVQKVPSPSTGGDMMAAIMAKRAAMQSHTRKDSFTGSTHSEKKPPPSVPVKGPPPVKPAELVSKPPVPPRNPSSSNSPRSTLSSNSGGGPIASTLSSNSGGTNTSSTLPEHLQQLKAEIMAEFKLELAQFKEEILSILQHH